MFSVLTATKEFDDPFVGSRWLNERGLHGVRVKAAYAMPHIRRLFCRQPAGIVDRALLEEGVAVVPNLLPEDHFKRLRDEVRARCEAVRAVCPIPQSSDPGFQPKIKHDWGFDRFDGSTLNRFIGLDQKSAPLAQELARSSIINDFSRFVTGARARPSAMMIYETHQGDEALSHDIQKDFHRDTFFPAMKSWYFLEDVELDDGPFEYVLGSHRLTEARLQWEAAQANAAIEERLKTGRAGGSSFRITLNEIKQLGYLEPSVMTVKANTLVMANTFGFHRRGDAIAGRHRLALYTASRPSPFLPVIF